MSASESRHPAPRVQHCLLGLLSIAALAASGSVARAQETRTESPEIIRAAAESFVRAELPRDSNVSSVTAGPLDSRLRLVRCTAGLHGQLQSGAMLQTHTMVGVACAGPVHWTVYVPVTVESRISVLILKHPVARDTRLTADDVNVETRKVTGASTAFLTDINDLHGRTVRRPLQVGTELSVDMFTPDLIVRHGQEVTLVAASGGIEVRAAGRALADAAGGARLKVQNLSSMKVVEGVVEGPDVVRVAQ